MRVIGYIEHPTFKISVFKNDGRTSVKFETERYEQTLKLGDDERLQTVEAVEKLLDPAFLEKISEGFRGLHTARLEAMRRTFPVATAEMFEEII